MAKRNALRDVDPVAITICKQGANRKRIFLRKATDESLVSLGQDMPLLKSSGWSAFYCVVAEPGWEEDPGMTGDRDSVDVWADEGEIRKAAHRLLKNGGYVNAAHDALAAEGCAIVESAVALADFTVEDAAGEPTTIRKGSWYVAIEASDEFRSQVEAGEITGVSLEGTGLRVPLEKKKDASPDMPIPKASSKAKTALAKQLPEVTDAELSAAMVSVQAEMSSTSLLQKIAKAVGLADDDPDLVALAKADAAPVEIPSFSSIIAESKVDQELPRAFDALQRVVWRAFSPMAQEAGVDAASAVGEAADEFATYVKSLVGTLPAEQRQAVAKELATLENNDEEAPVDDATRQEIEAIKKQGEDTATAVKALADGFEKLLERVAPKEDPQAGGDETPDPAALKKAMEDLDGKFGDLAGSLDTIAKSVEQLADSGTQQPEDAEGLRKQASHPLAGIL
jgi:hypothetical protein